MKRLIGLTGGIGSGKSSVARILADNGATIVDADQIARDVVMPGTRGLAALEAEFGHGVLSEDGSLNRQALADLAFATPEAKARLDSIMHPLVAQRTAEQFRQAPADAVVVHDVALLAELGMAGSYDAVVVVDADEEVRIARLVERGLREDDARQRIAHQASREDRLAVADYVIENNGSVAELEVAVDRVWEQILTSAT